MAPCTELRMEKKCGHVYGFYSPCKEMGVRERKDLGCFAWTEFRVSGDNQVEVDQITKESLQHEKWAEKHQQKRSH